MMSILSGTKKSFQQTRAKRIKNRTKTVNSAKNDSVYAGKGRKRDCLAAQASTIRLAAKFGLSAAIKTSAPVAPVIKPSARQTTVSVAADKPSANLKPADAETQKPKQKLICHACGKSITHTVAKFCWFNKPKFGGNIYCMDCQKKV